MGRSGAAGGLRRLGTVLVLSTVALPALAAEGVEWEVRHGVGGFHRPGGILPISITVENRSRTDRELRIALDAADDYRIQRSVSLPAGTRKALTLYDTAASFMRAYPVRLLDRSGRTLEEYQLTSVPLLDEALLVGIVGDHAMGWGPLVSVEDSRFRKAHLRLERLPDSAVGLAALSVLVWPDPRPADLRPEQLEALARWTDGGGLLVLAVNDTWLEASAGELAPLTRLRTRTLLPARELSALAGLHPGGPPRLEEPVSVAIVSAEPPASVWLSESRGALAALERRGRGTVALLGFDPRDRPLAQWAGWPDFWLGLLERSHIEVPEPVDPGGETWSFQGVAGLFVVRSAEIDPPPVSLLLVLFVVYLAVIGPVEYIALKRAKRLAWTWITFPLLVALMLTASWAFASGRGEAITARQFRLLDLSTASESWGEQVWVGLRAPRNGRYRVTARDPGAVPSLPWPDSWGGAFPMYGPGRARGSPPVAREVVNDQSPPSLSAMLPRWGTLVGHFAGDSPAEGARVEASLRLEGRRLGGSISNGLGRDLDGCWLLLLVDDRPMRFELGPLRRSETAELDALEGRLFSIQEWVDTDPDPFLVLARASAQRAFLVPEGGDEWDLWRSERAADLDPAMDWTPWLKAGGGILLGRAKATEPAIDGEPPVAAWDGIDLYRIPLGPEAIKR